jgi:hypothetical protein
VSKAGINVEYGVERIGKLERIAAKRGISRSDLLRRMADQEIADDEAGIERSVAPVVQITPADISRMVVQITKLHVEANRLHKSIDRRDRSMVDREATFEAEKAEYAGQIREAFHVSADGILGELAPAMKGAISDAVEAEIARVQQEMAAAKKEFHERAREAEFALQRTNRRWWTAAISMPTLITAMILLTIMIQLR